MHLVLHRMGLKLEEIDIYFNVDWYGTPGEIDILLLRKGTNEPLAIIESKARCFDIAHGYR